MKRAEDSSEPSTTSETSDVEDRSQEVACVIVPAEKAEEPSKIRERRNTNAPFFTHIIVTDFLVPAGLLCTGLSTLGIMAIAVVVLYLLHVFALNVTCGKMIFFQIVSVLELLVALATCIFAVIKMSTEKLLVEWLDLLGFDFDNAVCSYPLFGVIAGGVTTAFVIVQMVFSAKMEPKKLRKVRKMMTDSSDFNFWIELVWYSSLAYIGGSSSSFLFAPILVYVIYASFTWTIAGKICMNRVIFVVFHVYSWFYAGYVIWQLSKIGQKYSIEDVVKWKYIAPKAAGPVLPVMAMLFAYLSVEAMCCTNLGEKSEFSKFGHVIAEVLILLTFVGMTMYALCYPCILSMSWILLAVIASMFPMHIIVWKLFSALVIVYTLTFCAMVVTSSHNFVVNPSKIITDIGLFKFAGNFRFLVIGYYVLVGLIHLAKMRNANERSKQHVTSLEDTAEKAKCQEEESEWMEYEDDVSISSSIQELVKAARKPTRIERLKRLLLKIKKYFQTVVLNLIRNFAKFLVLGAIVVVGCTTAFYEDRWAWKVMCCVILLVVLLGLYFQWIFIILKLLAGLLLLVNVLFVGVQSQNWNQKIPHLAQTGFIPPDGMDLIEFAWPYYTLFLLLVLITYKKSYVQSEFPPMISNILFIVIAVLHLVFVLIYEISIFTFVYLMIAVCILTFTILDVRKGLLISTVMSSLFVSVQLALLMLTHFNSIRNLLASLLPSTTIFDMTNIEIPSEKVAILSFILFATSIALRSTPQHKDGKLTTKDFVIKEAKYVFQMFFFYICWILVFGYSVCNNYPTFIKFLISLCFIFGAASAQFVFKIRLVLMLFMMLFLGVQILCHVFEYEMPQLVIDYCQYLGLFLASNRPISDSAKNQAIGWQFGIIMLCALNARLEPPSAQDKKFAKKLGVRLYNALCALLHNWLPVIVQISLCVSALFNPSLFGWISFIVLIVVCFKELWLVKIALLVTILFNICFIIQYLLWLGCPKFLFSFRINGIINDWGKWIGIVNVSTLALISNCISALIFTMFLQYHLMFVDYDTRFNELPSLLRSLLRLFITHTYPIFMVLILIVSARIPSFDGFFFFIIVTVMLVASLLYDFSPRKSIKIMEWFIFFVLGGKIVSRIPVFTDKGIGELAKDTFDLPLQGDSAHEFMWIIAFGLLRICVHIMDMELFHEMQEVKARVMAYRFLHHQQLKVISQLDQDVIVSRNQMMYKQIAEMTSGGIQTAVSSLRNESASTLSRYEAKSTVNDSGKQKPFYKRILPDILYYVVDHLICFLAGTLPLVSEAGQNMLTLETIQIMLKKNIRAQQSGVVFELEKKEQDFFQKLPPSFKLQLDSIGDLCNYNFIPKGTRWDYLVRSILHLFRRISLTFLLLVVIIFVFMKPYIFAMFLVIYVISILCSSKMHNMPNMYRTLLIIVMVMNIFRTATCVEVVRNGLIKASESVALASMDISILKLFGIDPNDDSAIELFIVIASVWYVVEQLAFCNVFPNSYYYKKFQNIFQSFPEEFCYGIVNDPEKAYGLNVDPTDSIIKQFRDSFNQQTLRDSVHRKIILFMDLFSFFILVCCWNSWVTTTEGDVTGSVEMPQIKVTVLFVFIMIIHVVWMFVVYWAQLANRYIVLFVAHNLWLIYSVLLTFYYLGSKGTMNSSLQFFIILRIISHLITAHKCVKGGVLSSFVYPDFARHSTLIIVKNKFMRIVPFAFEIQMLLEYISQETCVGLMDYFIINDIKSQIEILIAEQTRPGHDDKYRRSNRYLTAGMGLLVLLLMLFLPLFFMCEDTPQTYTNQVIGVNLEIGLNTFPPMWSGYAQISPIGTNHVQAMIDSGLAAYQGFAKVSTDDMHLLDIPRSSFVSVTAEPQNEDWFNELFTTTAEVTPYYRFTFHFALPTGPGDTSSVVYTRAGAPLSIDKKAEIAAMFAANEVQNLDLGLSLPMTIIIQENNDIIEMPNARRSILLSFIQSNAGNHWLFEMVDSFAPIPFLNQGDMYRFVLYSGSVSESASEGAGSIGIGGIYILLIIVFGVVLRDKVMGQAQYLWIDRMERPAVLYRMFVAIDNVRATKEVEKEKDLSDTLLDLIKSTETVIQTTAAQTH